MDNFNINTRVNPKGLKKDQYDVIIIGAGIGGLVCGCYLAKAGMKVLMVERHFKVGGYLTSFPRGKFIFEAGAIEDLGKNSNFREIITELGIHKKINILESNSHIVILAPDYKINIYFDVNETIEGLIKFFPHQGKEIENFFHFIDDYNIALLYLRYRNKVFDTLLNEYFKDEKLKSIFRIFSSQIGVPSHQVSALSVFTYFKTFIINGGYYPKGGLQAFSNAFGECFKEFGGDLLLSKTVKKIIIKNNSAYGVIVDDKHIQSKYVVSNADATATFLNLVGEEHLKKNFTLHIKNSIPSTSVFIVYLGVNKVLKHEVGPIHELWDIPTYEIDNPFEKDRIENKLLKAYLYCYLPSFRDSSLAPQDSESIALCVFVPYLTKEYWQKKRNVFMDKLIARIDRIFPNIKGNIVEKETAIPQTLQRYTCNRDGAFKGWAPLTSQVDISFMPMKTFIENLYLVGHWVSTGIGEAGVPQAAYTGQKVANLIIKQKR